MTENKVYVKMIKWTARYSPVHEFLVLWTDHTWDEFQFNPKTYDYRATMQIGKITSKRMTKEQAIKYIKERIKEIES